MERRELDELKREKQLKVARSSKGKKSMKSNR